MVLISSEYGMNVNEQSITGSLYDVEKQHITENNYNYNPSFYLFKSTTITQGKGCALVLAVGDHTQAAQFKKSENEQLNPLQQ